jgi:excisionase family DNA binding protein
MEQAEEDFITIRELAAHWRLSMRTIRLYVADGAVSVQRLRGRVFVAWREVWRHEVRSRPARRTRADGRRPLLTIDEAAALTRYRRSYLYALAARGEVPTCRVFGSLRFIDTDLRAWMRAPRPCRSPIPCQESHREAGPQDHDAG